MAARACRKMRYPSLEVALDALAYVKRRHPEHPSRAKRFGVYRCPTCQVWHIGHMSAHLYRARSPKPK